MVWSQQTRKGQAMPLWIILFKMRLWVHQEMEKARKPGADPFDYTSLTYCALKAGAGEKLDEVVKLLQTTAKEEPPHMPFDVARPHRAIFLINRTLDKLA